MLEVVLRVFPLKFRTESPFFRVFCFVFFCWSCGKETVRPSANQNHPMNTQRIATYSQKKISSILGRIRKKERQEKEAAEEEPGEDRRSDVDVSKKIEPQQRQQ